MLPYRDGACHHGENQEDGGHLATGEDRCLVEPRDAEVVGEGPGVLAGHRRGEGEEQSRHEDREVPHGPRCRLGDGDGGRGGQRSGETGEHAVMDGPLGGCEHHQQQGDERGAEYPPGRPRIDRTNLLASQHHRECHEHRRQQQQQRHPTGQGAIGRGDGDEVVPQVLLPPRDGRPDDVARAHGVEHRCQGLITEDHEHDQRGGRYGRCHHSGEVEHPHAVAAFGVAAAFEQHPQHGPSAHDQHGDCDDTLRRQGESEPGAHRREGGR